MYVYILQYTYTVAPVLVVSQSNHVSNFKFKFKTYVIVAMETMDSPGLYKVFTYAQYMCI